MSNPQPQDEDGRPVARNGAVEITLALALLAVAAIVIYDSVRLGFSWREDGPSPGFFPFWVAVVLGVSSMVNLIRALGDADRKETFVTVPQLGRILAVLVPALVYVAFIGGMPLGPVSIPKLGIYLSSALYIFLFMMVVGREGPIRALLVGTGVSVALFLMFEKWFLVPLPKGPLEAMLGLG